MSAVRITRCRSCDEAIVWFVTQVNGARMPVNADSVDEADLEFRDGVPIFKPYEHESHFATCPAADKHRRRK